MKPEDPVRRFLISRGSPDFVVKTGLAGLVRRWKETSRSVRRGYPLGLDDFLNDLDGRQLISELLPLAKTAERKKMLSRVLEADAVVKRHSKTTRTCLWGAREARRHGWNSRKNWWYYRLPATGAETLQADLSRKNR